MKPQKIYRDLASPFVGETAKSEKRVAGSAKCFCKRVGRRVPEKDKGTLWAYVCSKGHVYYVA